MVREQAAKTWNGLIMLLVLLVALGGGIWQLIASAVGGDIPRLITAVVLIVVSALLLAGLFMVEPNQGRVLTLFGAYRGTERTPGLRWANPFLAKRSISLRVRNFETERLKVNDAHGNPVEIAAVVVWKDVDTFEALLLERFQAYWALLLENLF